MSAKFHKNGVINCTPIDGYDKVSILKNDIVVGENLVGNSNNFNGWITESGWTSSIDSDDGFTVYSFSRTGATSNTWIRIIPTLKVDPNDYPNGITVSLDIKTPDVSAINQTCIGSLQTYQASGERVGWFEPLWDLSKVVNNQWTRLSYTFSQSALKINYASGTTLSYTQFSFQLVQNGDIFIKKIKIEEGSKATPWCPNPSEGFGNTPDIYKNPIQAKDFIEL